MVNRVAPISTVVETASFGLPLNQIGAASTSTCLVSMVHRLPGRPTVLEALLRLRLGGLGGRHAEPGQLVEGQEEQHRHAAVEAEAV